MDFPIRINAIKEHQKDSWNDDIEEYLAKPQTQENSIAVEVDDAQLQSSLRSAVFNVKKILGASFRCSEDVECDPNIGTVVRTGKNLLRWYIQIYLKHLRVCRQRHESECNINALRSPDTLSAVVWILKWSAEDCRNLKLAHDASLYIFYATYSHFPGDKSASTGVDHLISHLEFPKECLEILIKTNMVPLALTLVRNLHSMAVCFPPARASILNMKILCDPLTETVSPSWTPKETTEINFVESCLAIVKWSLDLYPSFPSEDPEDKRAELVIEILNCFYALRKGRELVQPNSRFSRDSVNPTLEHMVVRLLELRLPARTDSEETEENLSKRICRCKLSVVSLLMDSDVSFGKYLVEISSFEALLEIFERQVDDIVDNIRIDSAATASLVPILVVLNRYSMANIVVQQKVKAFVFPSETEKKFQESFKENWKTKMGPLDAPKNSLRGKLITLLSWVDGYIKRCSAELMWTLCDSDTSEFTFRVGLGNALPLLNSKGLSPIPIPS